MTLTDKELRLEYIRTICKLHGDSRSYGGPTPDERKWITWLQDEMDRRGIGDWI